MREVFLAIVLIVVVMAVVAVTSIGLGFFNRAAVLKSNEVFGPAEVEVQREITQESKAFIDALNGASIDDIQAWNGLQVDVAKAAGNPAVAEAYEGQQQALVATICQRVGRMNGDTVAPEVRQFLVEHGNSCR